MDNKIHYLKMLVNGTVEGYDEFRNILDKLDRRYQGEEITVTVGLMLTIATFTAYRDALGEDLFCRNLNDIPDTKEALVELFEEISSALTKIGIDENFDDFKKKIIEAAE